VWSGICLGAGKHRELGGVVAGAAAGEDAVGQGQAADVGAGAQAGRAAAGRVQGVDLLRRQAAGTNLNKKTA
jgi:hypothetical protein